MEIAEDGAFTYTPVTSFKGTDSFEYTLLDGQSGWDTGTATVEVVPMNERPDGLPPGLDIDDLPPGLQMLVDENGMLPPGLQNRLPSLPSEIHLQPSYNLTDIVDGTAGDLSGFVLNGIAELDESGWSVSSAGDVNGDG